MFIRVAAVETISWYQNHMSPHKGFCCAHNAVYHRGSCSAFAKRAILKFGVFQGLVVLYYRIKSCRRAYEVLRIESEQSAEENKPIVIDGRTYSDCPAGPLLRQCSSGCCL